jgi:hypothetical protein
MNGLNEKINEHIEKNLPKKVGEVLQKRLKQADEFEAKIEDYKNKIEKYENLSNVKDKRIKELEGLVSTEIHLKEIEDKLIQDRKELETRENEIELQIMSIKLQEADRRAGEIAGFVGMVFKSPIYRKSTSENVGYGYEHFKSDGSSTHFPIKSIDEIVSEE